MLDFFRIGLALLGLWLSAVWQSLPFWQQAMLCAIPLLILQWCIRKLWQAFLVWFHQYQQQRRIAAIVASASNDDEPFGDFFLSLWQTSGLDYTRDEAERLYVVSRTNRELANHLAEV